jgi:hypothetical protein
VTTPLSDARVLLTAASMPRRERQEQVHGTRTSLKRHGLGRKREKGSVPSTSRGVASLPCVLCPDSTGPCCSCGMGTLRSASAQAGAPHTAGVTPQLGGFGRFPCRGGGDEEHGAMGSPRRKNQPLASCEPERSRRGASNGPRCAGRAVSAVPGCPLSCRGPSSTPSGSRCGNFVSGR